MAQKALDRRQADALAIETRGTGVAKTWGVSGGVRSGMCALEARTRRRRN